MRYTYFNSLIFVFSSIPCHHYLVIVMISFASYITDLSLRPLDPVMAEYITIMIINNKTAPQISSELEDCETPLS